MKFFLDRLGIELGDLKSGTVEKFSMMVEVTVVVLLGICLLMILGWIIWRLLHGMRVCFCPVSRMIRRTGEFGVRGQVKFQFVKHTLFVINLPVFKFNK